MAIEREPFEKFHWAIAMALYSVFRIHKIHLLVTRGEM